MVDAEKLQTLTDCIYNIEVKDTVDSTNTYLKTKGNLKSGDVLIAKRQTGGRGRLGRKWQSPVGNLYMSAAIKPQSAEKAPLISLAAAAAVAKALESRGIKAGIKWPNDIVVSGKKLCGILAESAPCGLCIVGIGINVHTADFPEKLINPAISLAEINAEADITELTADILNFLYGYTENADEMLEIYRKKCVNIGKTVKIISHCGEYTAEAEGINENGNLTVKTENGIKIINSGEVSVRGIYGYCD